MSGEWCLRQVKSMQELKIGDTVIDCFCDCGVTHFAQIAFVTMAIADENRPDEECFGVLPNCCGDGPDGFTAISADIVARHGIFLVADGVREEEALAYFRATDYDDSRAPEKAGG